MLIGLCVARAPQGAD